VSWRNYPSEFICPACDGEGETICGCCDNTTDCDECDGRGMVGIDFERMNREIAESYKANQCRSGSWELIENEEWVGRTDGVGKWYYRDYQCATTENA
jgi:hypothetical protein